MVGTLECVLLVFGSAVVPGTPEPSGSEGAAAMAATGGACVKALRAVARSASQEAQGGDAAMHAEPDFLVCAYLSVFARSVRQ